MMSINKQVIIFKRSHECLCRVKSSQKMEVCLKGDSLPVSIQYLQALLVEDVRVDINEGTASEDHITHRTIPTVQGKKLDCLTVRFCDRDMTRSQQCEYGYVPYYNIVPLQGPHVQREHVWS